MSNHTVEHLTELAVREPDAADDADQYTLEVCRARLAFAGFKTARMGTTQVTLAVQRESREAVLALQDHQGIIVEAVFYMVPRTKESDLEAEQAAQELAEKLEWTVDNSFYDEDVVDPDSPSYREGVIDGVALAESEADRAPAATSPVPPVPTASPLPAPLAFHPPSSPTPGLRPAGSAQSVRRARSLPTPPPRPFAPGTEPHGLQ